MYPKQQKAIKFVRKEFKASEQIKPNQNRAEQPNNNISAQEAKFRKELEFYRHDVVKEQHHLRQEDMKNPQMRHLIDENSQGRRNKHVRLSPDPDHIRKLAKLVMPQNFERVNLISQIENRLISCLERKKPYVSVKDLISEDDLKIILGKKERKIVTKEQYNQKLRTEPESIIKYEKRTKQLKLNNDIQANNIVEPDPSHFMDKFMLQSINYQQEEINPIDQDSVFDELQPRWFDMNFFSEDLQQNQSIDRPNKKRKPMAQDKTFIESQFFRKEPISSDLFISEKKPSKERKQVDRFDLRNLRVPKMNNEREQKRHVRQERRHQWMAPPIQTIEQSREEDLSYYPLGNSSFQKQSFERQSTPSIFIRQPTQLSEQQWSFDGQLF